MKVVIEIETYYLIDYENVGSSGLSGCDKLNKSDHIIIFFTKNATKINMSDIANHGDAELCMIEIPAGKQSTDIHIGSYLGYLVGTYKGKDCSIVVVSKDSDFDNVIKFWKNKTGVKSSRSHQIKVSASMETIEKTSNSSKKSSNNVSGAKKTMLNQEVMQVLRKVGFDAKLGNSTAQLVTGFYGENCLMNKVHNALRTKYSNYLEVYKAIKPILTKYDTITISVSEEAADSNKTMVNNKIIQLLSKAGFENDIIGSVASIVVKNIGAKNSKQQIYRTIISKYGQSNGLNIYNHIKKHI